MKAGGGREWKRGQGEGGERMVARGGHICRPEEERQGVPEEQRQAMEGAQAGKRKRWGME